MPKIFPAGDPIHTFLTRVRAALDSPPSLMRTLHTYFGRELLKAFLMTAVALTILMVMGGGVANIFRGEGIGAEEMAKVFAFLTPVAVTLILPVAALFSATITYGRASADNEVLAARAAGINVHRILLSAGLLGVFVTLFTLVSWNFMIPGLSAAIERITRKDLPAIVLGQFQKAKPLAFGKYRIMANGFERLDPQQMIAALASQPAASAPSIPTEGSDAIPGSDAPIPIQAHHTYLRLIGVSFLEIEDQEVMRYGTADDTIIDFDPGTEESPSPKITVDLQGVRTFDATRRQYYELRHQILGPIEIALPIKRKTKFEDLLTLMKFVENPAVIPEVQDRLWGLAREMMMLFLAREIDASLSAGKPFTLVGSEKSKVTMELTAETWRINPDDGRPEVKKVKLIELVGKDRRILRADEAVIELKSSFKRDRPMVIVTLNGNVEIQDDPPTPGGRIVRRPKETLTPVEYMDQPGLAKRWANFRLEDMLEAEAGAGLPGRQAKLHEKVFKRMQEYQSEIRGEIHFRMSYSFSAIAIVLLGAVLGIIVRNGQVLTAFGISCVPMAFVVVASIIGRNLADRPQYGWLSILVMWSSTVFMFGAVGFFATKVLRR